MYTLIVATKSGYSVSTFSHGRIAEDSFHVMFERVDVMGLYLYSPAGELLRYSMAA